MYKRRWQYKRHYFEAKPRFFGSDEHEQKPCPTCNRVRVATDPSPELPIDRAPSPVGPQELGPTRHVLAQDPPCRPTDRDSCRFGASPCVPRLHLPADPALQGFPTSTLAARTTRCAGWELDLSVVRRSCRLRVLQTMAFSFLFLYSIIHCYHCRYSRMQKRV